MIKIMHVDDQPQQQKVVKKILDELNDVELVAQFSKAEEAKLYVDENEVDVAILDIEMPGKDGLWLAKCLSNTNTFIVFLTAHSKYSLVAFDMFALHYILKPVTKDNLQNVIDRYHFLKSTSSFKNEVQKEQVADFIDTYKQKLEYPSRIFVNNLKQITIINLSEVLYLIASGPYTTIYTSNGKKVTSSKILKMYADILEKHPDFIRIHRAHIVNKNYVKAILRDKHIIEVLMIDGAKLQVTPQKRAEILDLIIF